MKNNKVISIIIIILLIAILAALIWVGMFDTDEEQNIMGTNNNEQEDILATMKLSELVYDAEYDKESDAKEYEVYKLINRDGNWENDSSAITVKLSDVQYPYINIDSTDAQKANNEIKNLYIEYEEEYKNMEKYCREDGTLYAEDYQGNIIIDWEIYSAYKYENILSVVVRESAHWNNEIFDYTTWTFNLDSKELISFDELCSELGYSESNVSQKVEIQVESKLEEYKTEYDLDFDVDEYLELTMDDYDTEKYFVDNEGRINVVVGTHVPFEKEYYEFIYTVE